MFLALMALFAIEFASGLGVSPPNVKDFTPILSKELELQVDDYRTAFIGLTIVYQNPSNPNEFVKVYYQQVALLSERAKEKSNSETGNRNTNLFNIKYHNKQEAEAISRVQKATDAFAYVQWRIIHDPRTGQDFRTGFTQIWLLGPNGVWTYCVQSANEKSALEPSPFSEPSKSNKFVMVGLKFTLGGTVRIVRVDQDDILAPTKEAANEQK